ncbi:hypothetical protein QJS64_17190 [Paraclostridium bifermentans]|uniref:Uncharacterized protein n=1 Tax=Paraclostridium bifermentans TaxID=1490 RepID=A0ABY8R4Q4_PARBF|nr:hypothetical protein QJS64_17190 [Paraclostridium bifermentans]
MSKYILAGASELGKNSMEIIEKFNFGSNIVGYMDNDYSKIGKIFAQEIYFQLFKLKNYLQIKQYKE